MISITSIKSYMFCPMKLYLEKTFNEESKDIILYKTIKELRIDINDLFQRNLRKITKEMDLEEIEKNLNKNIEEYVENSLSTLVKIENEDEIDQYNKNLDNTNEKSILEESKNQKNNENLNNNNNNLKETYPIETIEEEIERIDRIKEIKTDLETEIYYNLKILSLKAKKAMLLNQKDGNQIAELFFPTSMYSYLMKDLQLDIIGTCDKIEIIDGKYFPISIKSSNPPLKGVWDGDAIELIAAALLIENEFNTEVFVGFIDYLKIGDRRVVVMDANLRKSFFRILSEVDDIINNSIVPEIKKDNKKCIKCDYNLICNQELDFE